MSSPHPQSFKRLLVANRYVTLCSQRMSILTILLEEKSLFAYSMLHGNSQSQSKHLRSTHQTTAPTAT